MVIMWVLLGVALAFVVMLRLLILRTRRFDRILAERRAEMARTRERAAREAAERARTRGISADGGRADS